MKDHVTLKIGVTILQIQLNQAMLICNNIVQFYNFIDFFLK